MTRIVPFLMILVLAACGFTPMYGNSSKGDAGLEKVEIALIPDESGVYLRNLLIDAFYEDGYPDAPAYQLSVRKIDETITDLDITTQSEATRKQIRLNTNFALTDMSTGAVVLQRQAVSITSYNVLGSQFTTRVSESDAREAALNDLARQIETQIGLYFKR